MNIAIIALQTARTPIVPPLGLAYVAAALEQRRHIVRMYDLALTSVQSSVPLAQLLKAFRPQAIVIAGERQELLDAAVDELSATPAAVLRLCMQRESDRPTQVCNNVVAWLERQKLRRDDKGVTSGILSSESAYPTLKTLPLPARHLLKLECYELRACGGGLQTTLAIGQRAANEYNRYELRDPAFIVSELRSVAQEHGVRHYRFCGAPLTADVEWLGKLAQSILHAKLEIQWDGTVQPSKLDGPLLALLRRAGCESLRFDFNALEVLESAVARRSLREIVAQARQQSIYARAELALERPFDAIQHLVDVAATFGLDDVVFQASSEQLPQQHDAAGVEEMARRRYSVERSRQRLITRFGVGLGSLMWNMQQSWLMTQLRGAYKGSVQIDEHDDMMTAA